MSNYTAKELTDWLRARILGAENTNRARAAAALIEQQAERIAELERQTHQYRYEPDKLLP